MSDIGHFWSSDLSIAANGDLAVADGDTLAQQELLRALMTNPQLADSAGNPIASPDYTWHADFGAGIPRRIGKTLNVSELRGRIQSTIKTIAGIATSPTPVVTVTPFNNGAAVTIQYADAVTGQVSTLSFDINQ
jgi:hypothetical protein